MGATAHSSVREPSTCLHRLEGEGDPTGRTSLALDTVATSALPSRAATVDHGPVPTEGSATVQRAGVLRDTHRHDGHVRTKDSMLARRGQVQPTG